MRPLWFPLGHAHGIKRLRQRAFGESFTDEEEDIVWSVVQQLYAKYLRGELSQPQLVQVALAWKGTTNYLGWKGVKGSIEPGIRGPLAYVLGRRYLCLGLREGALELFRNAQQDAAEGSTLRQLAEAQIAQLQAADASR